MILPNLGHSLSVNARGVCFDGVLVVAVGSTDSFFSGGASNSSTTATLGVWGEHLQHALYDGHRESNNDWLTGNVGKALQGGVSLIGVSCQFTGWSLVCIHIGAWN